MSKFLSAVRLLILLVCIGSHQFAQAAGSGSLAASAFVPSQSNCKFSNGALTLDFGQIDPSSLVNATASVTKAFTCNGSAPMATFSISADDGLHSTGVGARRMQHATAAPLEFMAYGLSLSPTSATVAKGVAQTLTITGTIQPVQFQNARAGAYSDTVIITLTP